MMHAYACYSFSLYDYMFMFGCYNVSSHNSMPKNPIIQMTSLL